MSNGAWCKKSERERGGGGGFIIIILKIFILKEGKHD